MKTIPILYEDKNIISVNKPSKMMVYEMGENFRRKKCLLSKLQATFQRPFYPIHWLDRACSGIVLLAKDPNFAFELAKAMSAKNCVVKYTVLVKGHFQEAGVFSFPLKDWRGTPQPAITLYRPEFACGPVTLMEVQTKTDCRHQIRRHFSRRCANVIGDRHYGQGKWNMFFNSRFGLSRIFMHLSHIELNMCCYNKPLVIECPLPKELVAVVQELAATTSFINMGDLRFVYSPYNAISSTCLLGEF